MKNEYKITKDLMKSWAKENHLHGAANIILFSLWCILGILGTALLIFSITMYRDWFTIYMSALFVFVSVFKLFFARFVFWAKKYKIYCTTYGVTEWMRTIEFADDEIVLTDYTTVSKLQYRNIERIKEKNNTVWIFLNHNTAIRLYKDAFVEGSWEECKQKIDSMRNK